MKNLTYGIPRWGLGIVAMCCMFGGQVRLGAVPPDENPRLKANLYEEPKLLVGNIFAPDGGAKKLLFKSVRTSTRSNATVRVVCEYTYPNGSLAARDRIVYRADQLVSFETEGLQRGDKGTAVIGADPQNPGQRRIFFEYTTGLGGAVKRSSDSEKLENDTLVDDMIPVFIVSHWRTLMEGKPAKFRYIVPSRQETVGFKLVKDSETTSQGKAAVRIKMEPTSFIIAQLVDPLYFVVEKERAHRIREYIGRTTPLLKDGDKWKDLDAVTVFDWHDTEELRTAER